MCGLRRIGDRHALQRALVQRDRRTFVCDAENNCSLHKEHRSTCRACRIAKCLAIGMDPLSIQGVRDKIGYTKRNRKCDLSKDVAGPSKGVAGPSHADQSVVPRTKRSYSMDQQSTDDEEHSTVTKRKHRRILVVRDSMQPGTSRMADEESLLMLNENTSVSVLERLALLEYNFSMLMKSDTNNKSYASLDEALDAPSCFSTTSIMRSIDTRADDDGGETDQLQRIYTLYIDWAKMFLSFRSLPQVDKIILLQNHATSYLIMSKAFRKAYSENPIRYASAHLNMLLSSLKRSMTVIRVEELGPFLKRELSTVEFGALQAIMFFDPDAVGLDGASQRNVANQQKIFIIALHDHVTHSPDSEASRFPQIILRTHIIRIIAEEKKEYLRIFDIFNPSALSDLVRKITFGSAASEPQTQSQTQSQTYQQSTNDQSWHLRSQKQSQEQIGNLPQTQSQTQSRKSQYQTQTQMPSTSRQRSPTQTPSLTQTQSQRQSHWPSKSQTQTQSQTQANTPSPSSSTHLKTKTQTQSQTRNNPNAQARQYQTQSTSFSELPE